MCIFVPKDEIPGGTFMKKFCIAALAATLALGTMITAQAADTALDLENVGASFAITRRSNDTIGISARSMGKINVQLIMEKLGGGGHLSNAATQIKDVTIEEARQELLKAIDEYEEEND